MSGTQPLTASTPFDPNALRAKANSLRLIAKVLMGVAAFVLLIGGYVFFNANDIVSKSVGNKELLAAAEENSKRIEDTQKKVDEIVKAVRTAQTTGRVTTGYEQLPDGNPWPQPLSARDNSPTPGRVEKATRPLADNGDRNAKNRDRHQRRENPD